MTALFSQQGPIIVVDDIWIARVKEDAAADPLGRARLNLHRDEADQVQETLTAFRGDSIMAPHRHRGRTESIHVIEGRALIVFFDDSGQITQRLIIGPASSGLPSLYRLASEAWHVVIPLDETLVVHEIASGPFLREAVAPPQWAPREFDELRLFVADLRGQATTVQIEVLGTDQLDDPLMYAIAELKTLHWPYPIESQLAWLKMHAADSDLHVVARNRHAVVGYLRIPRRAADIDQVPGRIFGVSTVVVHPGWREMGVGRQLLRSLIDAFEEGAVGLLQCRRDTQYLYGQAGWRPFFGTARCRSDAREQEFCRDEMMMIFTSPYREVRQILLEGDPF